MGHCMLFYERNGDKTLLKMAEITKETRNMNNKIDFENMSQSYYTVNSLQCKIKS